MNHDDATLDQRPEHDEAAGLDPEVNPEAKDPEGEDSLYTVPTEAPEYTPWNAEAPAEERIATLLDSMKTHRTMFLNIIRACEEPVRVEELNEKILEMQEHEHSVYGPSELCALLERSSAIERVDENGTPAAEAVPEPVVKTDENGAEYLEIPDEVPTFWRATAEGLQAAQSDDPLSRLFLQIEEDHDFEDVYRQVLEMCSDEKGRMKSEIEDAVDDRLAGSEPRLFASYFIEALERSEAIVWSGSWKTTATGMDALQKLSERGEDEEDLA